MTWISCGLVASDRGTTSDFATSRYRALMPASALRSRGVEAEVIGLESVDSAAVQARLRAAEIIVVQKLSLTAESGASNTVVLRNLTHVRKGYAMAAASVRRALTLVPTQARIVFDINDDGFEIDEFVSFYRSVVPRASGWITATDFLAKRLRRTLGVSATVVPDAYEGSRGAPRAPLGWLARALQGLLDRVDRAGRPGSRVSLLWFGHPVNLRGLAFAADELFRATDFVAVDLICVTALDDNVRTLVGELNRRGGPRFRAQAIAWSRDAVWNALRDCDAVIIPADLHNPRMLAKSANRLLEALVAGRLAICHPVPAYLEFQKCAWIGERLDDGLRWAITNPGQALARIRFGQRYVEERHSPTAIGSRWLAALETLPLSSGPAGSSPSGGAALRLNLGCGDKILPGYVNVDASARQAAKPDVICDIRHLHPFASACAEEVLAVHVVEHFAAWEIEDVLREWIRVLRPGGRLVVECPNIAHACERISREPHLASEPWSRSSQMMWVLYGDPRWRDPLMGHRWGYTPESLIALLRSAGLVDVRQEPAQFKQREPRDMRVVGIVPAAGSSDSDSSRTQTPG